MQIKDLPVLIRDAYYVIASSDKDSDTTKSLRILLNSEITTHNISEMQQILAGFYHEQISNGQGD